MAEPFLGEIRLFTFGFAPQGWAQCNGQLMAINQNQALFALLGTMYGGNGVQNFSLPNAQGRVFVHAGGSFIQGELAGEQSHTLTTNELPAHGHSAPVGGSGGNTSPAGSWFGIPDVNPRMQNLYATSGGSHLASQAVGNAGGSQPHNNMQPYLVLNYCIALSGIFPSRN